jgi:hypothetical protein
MCRRMNSDINTSCALERATFFVTQNQWSTYGSWTLMFLSVCLSVCVWVCTSLTHRLFLGILRAATAWRACLYGTACRIWRVCIWKVQNTTNVLCMNCFLHLCYATRKFPKPYPQKESRLSLSYRCYILDFSGRINGGCCQCYKLMVWVIFCF